MVPRRFVHLRPAKKWPELLNKTKILAITHMKDLLTPEFVAAFFGLLHNPSTYAWAIVIVAALWALGHLCNALAALVKELK